jgi:hypothetical protein
MIWTTSDIEWLTNYWHDLAITMDVISTGDPKEDKAIMQKILKARFGKTGEIWAKAFIDHPQDVDELKYAELLNRLHKAERELIEERTE